MPLLGQASGGFTESSSALRILHVGIRNTVGVLTDDSFTQTNPPVVPTNISAQVDQGAQGVLSGSVCFARPDVGSNNVGGPGDQAAINAVDAEAIGYRPLGCFINSSNGNAFENTPGTASGKGPYVSSQGTYGNALFETALIGATADGANNGAGQPIVYGTGQELMASLNGYLMPIYVIGGDGGVDTADLAALSAERAGRAGLPDEAATVIGIVKMPPDAVMNEVVYDQRI